MAGKLLRSTLPSAHYISFIFPGKKKKVIPLGHLLFFFFFHFWEKSLFCVFLRHLDMPSQTNRGSLPSSFPQNSCRFYLLQTPQCCKANPLPLSPPRPPPPCEEERAPGSLRSLGKADISPQSLQRCLFQSRKTSAR